MKIPPFKLERYFAEYEFSSQYLLSSSDCESLSLSELIARADPETLKLWDELKLGYTESAGHLLLRNVIAETYAGIVPESTVVAAPEEAIFLLMHALLESGDHVVCTFPGYQSLYEVARSIGCEVSFWEPDEAQGWRFAIDKLAGTLKPNTKLVVVNFPHNPTGCLPERDDFQAIVDLVREQGAYLLSDEMYRYLELDKGTTLPAGCEMYERAVSLSGLSKTYGLPGLRIGWLASQASEVLARVQELKDYTTICNSAPSEILAIAALRQRSGIIREQCERIRRNVAILDTFFDEHQDWFTWNRPKGGSVCFPRMLAVEDTQAFCGELLADTGILLVPSSQFQYGEQHVRIGYGRDDLAQVLELFAEYLEQRLR